MRYDGWFRLAHELKQTLHHCLGCPGPVTHRQFLAWQWRLKQQWNAPDRHDHYLMLIACEVRRVLARNPERIQLKDFRLEFNLGKRKRPSKELQQNQLALTRGRWFAAVGYKEKK